MTDSTVFSTADLLTGFHQIPCVPETKKEVAITENWDLHLPKIFHQMNSAKHNVTKMSPFEIETGYPGENPSDK
jgi:hypothetical protein